MEFETIICFETHVELKTETKLFCDCPVRYDAAPNHCSCPVCTGQPGALPVLNRRAVEFAIRAGVALGCAINRRSRFARKNYFYPDLPKGYQISQYERPFCEDGTLEIIGDDGEPYPVGIKRIHLEEDAGKLVHSSDSFEAADFSLVDYNRSSVPLLEIVGDHERNPLRSIPEARQYLEKLRQVLRYIGISDCSMEKGQLRCDVNVSLRRKGQPHFGNRTEVKNMSSFRFIADALQYEIRRQAEILRSGGAVDQETRLFDEQKGITLPMRSKEDAPDYRYFPDPDLVEVEIDDAFLEGVRRALPELPDRKIERVIAEYGIARKDALILTRERAVCDYFERSAARCADARRLGAWLIKELFRLLNDASVPIEACPVPDAAFAELIDLIAEGTITDTIGRTVLEEMFATSRRPGEIIAARNLQPIQDEDALSDILNEVLKENPDIVDQILRGNRKPMDFLIGQVMRKTRGKADARKVKGLLEEKFAP